MNSPPGLPPRWVDFDTWWNEVVFVDKKGREMSRKDLILSVADQDGGAHVDPVLNESYAELSRRNSLAWRTKGSQGDVPIEGAEKAAIRQISHEVLKTFEPEMPILKNKIEGALVTDMYAVIETKERVIPKVGRNTFCPCGSGKKYKKCHGKV